MKNPKILHVKVVRSKMTPHLFSIRLCDENGEQDLDREGGPLKQKLSELFELGDVLVIQKKPEE